MFDQTMAPMFARQHGLITRSQAVKAGATDEIIEHRVRIGRWARVAPGVYQLMGVAVTWHQRALAACLSAGPHAVLSHRSAAVLLGVSGFRPGPLDITVPPSGGSRNALATVHRSVLLPGARTVCDHIPLTSPVRTLVDLSKHVLPSSSRRRSTTCCAGGWRRSTGSSAALGRSAVCFCGRCSTHGRQVRLPGSVAEMRLVRRLVDAGLPPPVRQHWVAAARARVDLAYPAVRLALELDSFRWHAGAGPFGSDRARGNRIVAAGWHLLRAVPEDLDTVVNAAAHVLRRVA